MSVTFAPTFLSDDLSQGMTAADIDGRAAGTFWGGPIPAEQSILLPLLCDLSVPARYVRNACVIV
jgi:hypothetical protein